MRQMLARAALAAVALVSPLLVPSTAHAGLAACGNINVEANAQCEVSVEGGCQAQCTAVSFTAACNAQGYTECSGTCDVPSVDCSGSCEADCSAECEVQPAEFSCEGNCSATCQGDCSADCSAECEASANKGECEAQCKGSCEATCSGECSASCEGQPAMASCDGQCKASCEGSCTAKTNLSCQVECQGKLQASCEAELEGGCEVECEAVGGVLECDGQYVDHGGKLEECIDALKAVVEVKGSASGSASCQGASCKAEGEAEASASCAMVPGNDGAPLTGLLALGALGGLLSMRRRR